MDAARSHACGGHQRCGGYQHGVEYKIFHKIFHVTVSANFQVIYEKLPHQEIRCKILYST